MAAIKLPHISRIISRTILLLAFSVLFIHGSKSNQIGQARTTLKASAGYARNFPKIVVVILILMMTLVTFKKGPSVTDRKAGQSTAAKLWQEAIVSKNRYLETASESEVERARSQLAGLLSFDSRNVYAWRLLSELEIVAADQTEKEIRQVLRVLESRPDYIEGWERLAILAGRIGNGILAQEADQKVQELKDNNY